MEDALFTEVMGRRDTGSPVDFKRIRSIARELLRDPQLAGIHSDRVSQFKASNPWIKGFMARYHLSHRRGTTTKYPLTTAEEARRTLSETVNENMRTLSVNRSRLWNMDETSILFNPCTTTTIDLAGRNSIRVYTRGNAKLRCTVALTIPATGQKHDPFVIFKGDADLEISSILKEFAWHSRKLRGWIKQQC